MPSLLRMVPSQGAAALALCGLFLFGILACGDSGTTPDSPSIALSSSSVALQAPAAGDVQTADLSITNSGGGSLGSATVDVTYSTPQAEDWLSVEVDGPASPSIVSFRATPPVRPGTYSATVVVSESTGDSEAEVAVTLTVSARPLLYMIDQSEDRLRRMDPVTLAITEVGALGVEFSFGDCTWDPLSESLVATGGRGNNTLLEIDLATGAASVIGTHGVEDLFSLEAHPPSQSLYGWKDTAPRALQRIDRATAVATQVGDPFGRIAALGWDSRRESMLGVGANVGPAGGFLFSVDLALGTAALLGSAPPLGNAGLTYDPGADLFWLVDTGGQIMTFDPANGLAANIVATLQGQNACIAYVP